MRAIHDVQPWPSLAGVPLGMEPERASEAQYVATGFSIHVQIFNLFRCIHTGGCWGPGHNGSLREPAFSLLASAPTPRWLRPAYATASAARRTWASIIRRLQDVLSFRQQRANWKRLLCWQSGRCGGLVYKDQPKTGWKSWNNTQHPILQFFFLSTCLYKNP